jgi:hypothetical protein
VRTSNIGGGRRRWQDRVGYRSRRVEELCADEVKGKGKSSKKGPSEMAGIAFVSEGATNQVDWRAAMVADLIAKTEPPPGGRSTFLAKREC